MDTWLLLQYAIIALAVLASAGVVAKKQFPGSVRKLRIGVALYLLREERPSWMRRLGRAFAPPSNASGAAACGSCDGCGPSTPNR
jgi:hypothetical protein